ncbi:MAG: YjjG family noncanonical pyrimidine nucleotidase [Clostridia bacterium]|nr:YjjG family noncanonical pyrimidine nucleotidase [Clostridia bacterium]
MKYTVLLLDADMTLLNFDEDEKNALYGVLNENGIRCDEKVLSLYHEINIGFWKRFEKGEIEKSEIGPGRFGELVRQLSADADGNRLNLTYMQKLSEGGAVLDGAPELLRILQEKGAELYIITNGTDFIQQKRLKKSGLTEYINGVFISDTVGHQKPKKEFFDCVLSQIKEKDKSKMLIVGDSLTSDIRGGLNSGIDTCLYAPGDIPVSEQIKPKYTVRSYGELIKLLEK